MFRKLFIDTSHTTYIHKAQCSTFSRPTNEYLFKSIHSLFITKLLLDYVSFLYQMKQMVLNLYITKLYRLYVAIWIIFHWIGKCLINSQPGRPLMNLVSNPKIYFLHFQSGIVLLFLHHRLASMAGIGGNSNINYKFKSNQKL